MVSTDSNMTDIEKRRLIHTNDFVAAWFKFLPSAKTYEDAYEKVEEIYEDYFGKRRYSCYSSFRVVKNRLIKNK